MKPSIHIASPFLVAVSLTALSAAPAAAQRIELGRALGVLVQGPERAFLGAALALRAALQQEVGVGLVAQAGLDRGAAGRQLEALDRLERGAGPVFTGELRVQRGPHAAGIAFELVTCACPQRR